MMNLKKEYNEFGPWITEISQEEDITHQFIHLKDEILAADLAIKLPVDKEWRDVKEGELLYNALITLSKDIIAYDRIIDGVAYSCKIAFHDIDYIQLKEGILSNVLKIGTPFENISLSYMPIPMDLAKKIIDLLVEGFVNNNNAKQLIHKPSKDGFISYKEGVHINEGLLKELLCISN